MYVVGPTSCISTMSSLIIARHLEGISLFLPYERNTEHVRMPAPPVGSGGLG